MRLRKRKKKMTAGNRAPISVLKDSSPFHARHTDTSEAADTLHERGTARKILLTEPPPPPRRLPAGSHNEHTAFQSRTTPVHNLPPPPPPAPPGCAIRERGGEAPLIPRPNAAQEGCRHARPYVSLAPAQLELPRPPARPPPPRGAPPAPRSPRSLPVRLHPSGC